MSRHQFAAERLLENSSLRDGLTDEQFQPLLDWGLAHVERAVMAADVLPDADADALVDQMTTAVSQVLRQINRLVDGAGYIPVDEAQSRRRQMLEALHRVEPESGRRLSQQPLPDDWPQLTRQEVYDFLAGSLLAGGALDEEE